MRYRYFGLLPVQDCRVYILLAIHMCNLKLCPQKNAMSLSTQALDTPYAQPEENSGGAIETSHRSFKSQKRAFKHEVGLPVKYPTFSWSSKVPVAFPLICFYF